MSSAPRAKRSVPASDRPTDWEDLYHRLKSDFDVLKNEYNQVENDNKLKHSRIMKLESDLAQVDKKMGTTKADRAMVDQNAAMHEEIHNLSATIETLKARNRALVEQVDKKKKELASARRPSVTSLKRPLSASAASAKPEVEIVAGPNHRAAAPLDRTSDTDWFTIAQQLKARLATAQEQITQLKDEIARLRAAPAAAGKVPLSTEADNSDLKWRLQQLQTQYDYTVAKLSAQSENSKHSEVKLEEYHQKVKELRRSLEELRYEKEISDAKAARVEALEETVTELRQLNRSLEDKIGMLCQAPYISDAFGMHESKMRYEDLAAERADLLAKVEHLQEAVRTHYSALTSLKQQANQLREDKEAAEKAAEEMRMQMQDLQAGQNLMQDQLRLYSGDDGVDVATLERALTMVKRASEPYGKLPFLEDPEGEKLVSLPAVKRKLEEYQILNLRLAEESDRLESMLKLQTGISRDLHKELEALVRSRDKDKQDLQQKAADFEEIALKRLDKIHALEAQVRQFVYGLAKNSKGPRSAKEVMMVTPDEKTHGANDEVDNALLNELIEDKGGNIRDDENLMEIWVHGAVIRDGNLLPGSSTFVVIDFFDYESQTTSLLSGLKPQWDFAATYKITVDDFLLRFLATGDVTLELNMASQGDYSLLARCTVQLSALLKSRPRLQLVNHPMISVKTGQVIANISVDFRLALPVSELYRLFLERHPTERRHIEEISAKRVLDAASNNELARNLDGGLVSLISGKEDDSRLYNELEILIHRANGLPMSADGKPPNAYVHFQLLGHPDKLTNPIMNTTSPEFNEKFTFPMITYDQQIRLLQRSQLQLSLIDMRGEELDAKSEGLIGEVFVKLAALAEGAQITDTFNVKNVDGKNVAELYVTLKWKHPLKRHRDLGPRALSGVEVETLISAFSPGDMHEGVVDYKAFCRFIDPPVHVLSAMEKLRNFCMEITEREGRSARDVFQVLLDPTQYIDEDTFVQRMLKTHVDVLPMDLVQLFKFIDSTEELRITLDKFLAVMNLDEIAGLPVLLQNKLRERTKDLNGRGIPVLKLFQEADQWGADGLVTRGEFKNVLKKRMGFALVDEPDPVHEFVGDEMGSPRGSGKGRAKPAAEEDENDVLNDTLGSEDNVLVQNDLGRDHAPTARASSAAAGSSMKQDRALFEEKVADIQQRSQKVLASTPRGGAPAPAAVEGKNLLGGEYPVGGVKMDIASADPFQQGGDHRVGVGSNAGKPMSLDASLTDKLATKLQSHYRGYSARKSTPLRGSKASAQSPGPMRNAPAADYSQNLAGASSILAVENILYESLKAGNKGMALPDLAAGFLTVDMRRTGLVNRKQFAHVLKQFPAVQLHGAELRAAMDFFDVSGDGTSIDYNAFLRLYNYREPELIPAILKLQTMTLGRNSFAHFRKYDQSGNGYIRRSDMMKCLKELGHGVIAQAVMQTMLQLFELRLDGQVNYANFFEYIRENDLTQKLDALSLQFYHLVTGSGSPNDLAAREWFAKLDSMNAGRFLIQQLSTVLQAQGVQASKEAVLALYSQMDLDGTGVSFSRLVNWLASFAEAAKDGDSQLSLFSSLSLAELQRKAGNYIVAAAQSTAGLEMISDSYLVYDWRRSDSGAIAKPLFVRATRRAGFPFTMNELRTLTSEFSLQNNGEVLSYKKFLAWATPDARASVATGIAAADAMSSFDGHPISSAGTPRKNAGIITKFLEKCIVRGIDLLTVFGRYDSISVGRITSSEFCAALSDMGMSSVTQHEAVELAERYRAAAGDFIIYRKIVSELLRHTDEITGATDIDPIEVMRGALQNSGVSPRRLQDVFEYYDRKGNGNVRKEDLETIMDEAKLKIKRFEIDFIADKFASGDSGWVNYTPLLKALEGRMVERSMFKKPTVVSDEISAKVKALIENWILQGIDYRSEFDRFDDDYSGAVLQSRFREVLLERLRANLSAKELEVLEKTYRYSEDVRRVSFVRLIHHLHPRNFGRVTFQGVDASGVHEPWEIAEQLRQKIRRRVKFLSPGELRKPYQHFARSKDVNKSVTQEDFSVAVRNLGLRLASDQEKAVFEMIAHSGGKTFKYNDFVVFVCDPQHVDIIWKLRKLIARARVSEKEIINALNQEDTNASGLITVKQFLRAFKSCSIQLTDADAVRLMLRFDVEDNQHFDNDRFFRFLRGKQSEDEDFDDADFEVTKRLTDVATRKSAEAAESHTWSSLKRRVEEKLDAGFTGNEVFALFDRDGRGTLDVAALNHGIQRLGLTLTSVEVRAMLRRMSVLAGGAVTKASFFEAMDIDLRQFAVDDRDLVGGERGRRVRRSRMGVDDEDFVSERPSPRDDFSSLLTRIKDQMEIAVNPRDRANLPEVLRRALETAAMQKSGFVSERELSRSFEALGVRAQRKDITQIFDRLDTEEIGLIAHDALITRLFPGAAVRRRSGADSADLRADSDVRVALRKRPDLLEEVVSQLRTIESKTEKTLEDLLAVFRKADFDKSGSLGKADFAECLSKFGFKLVSGMERDLVDSITQQSARLVRYGDFVDALRVDIKVDSVLDDVILRLRKHFSRDSKHGKGIEDIFSSIDRDGDGQVDVYEFEAALDKIGIPLSREEAKRIVSRFSVNGTTIKFREFLKAFHSASVGTSALEPILGRVRVMLEAGGGGKALKRAFEQFDSNRNGQLSESEFLDAMRSLKLDLLPSEVRQIFKTYDTNGDNSLNYAEFLALLDSGRPKSTMRLDADTELIVKSIRRKLEDYLGPGTGSARKIKETFAEMDSNRSGTIDKVEFERAMKFLKVDVSRADVQLLYERFDPDRNGMDYTEFLELLNFAGASVRTSAKEESISPELREDTDAIVKSIRRKLEDYLGPGSGSARKIKETFADIDGNRNGRIDKNEFEKAMTILRVDIARADIARLFERFDRDRNGLDYKEFLDLLGFDGAGSKVSAQLKDDTDAIVTRIRRKLEDYLGPGASAARKIKETFAEMDRNRNGTIDKNEFEKAMSNLRVELSRADIALLFERFDTNRNGLDYKEFLDLLNFNGSAAAKVSPQLKDDTDAIVARIRRKIEDYLGPGASAARKIKETFAEIDRNRNGTIDKNEFEQAMKLLRVEVSRPDIALLFERFDTNRNGLDYKEFLDLLNFSGAASTKVSAQLKDDTDAITARIRRKLEDYLGPGASAARKIKETFAEIDRNRNGTIDKNEFEQAMKLLRVEVSRPDIALLFERFDTNRNGLDYKEFLDLLNFNGSAATKVSPQLKDDTDAITARIRRKLQEYLGPGSGSARKIKETFADMDRNRNGTIDKNEFERAMTTLRVDIPRADIALLFERFDTNRNGLDYKEFLDLLNFDGSASTVDAQLKEDTDAITARIRRKLEDYLGPGTNSARRIKETFAEMDRDRSGTLDKNEFEQAMKLLRADTTRADIARLYERFDTDRNGLDYKEFLDLLNFSGSGINKNVTPLSKELKDDTNAIVARIRRKLEDYLGPGARSAQRIKETFAEIDGNRNGLIDKNEFERAMTRLKVDLSRSDVSRLYERYDRNHNGLDYLEFMEMIGFSARSGVKSDVISPESKVSSDVKLNPRLQDDTDAILSRIRNKLEDYLGPGAGSARKIKEIFADIDRDKSGTIDKVEFEKAMGVLRVAVTTAEIRLLFERFDTNHRGLNYREFMDLIGFQASPRKPDVDESKVSSGSKMSPQLKDDTDAIIDRIRRKLEDYLGPGANSAQKIKETFAEMDSDRSGTIDKVEFAKAMSVLRVNLSTTDVRLLYERFDTNRKGLDYKEFMNLIGFHSSPRHLRF